MYRPTTTSLALPCVEGLYLHRFAEEDREIIRGGVVHKGRDVGGRDIVHKAGGAEYHVAHLRERGG